MSDKNENSLEDAANDEVMQTMIRVDLHCHSSFSDGDMTPEQIAEKLFDAEVKYAALADHDTLAGLPSFRHALMKYGIGFVTGAEITALINDYLVHLLAYGFDPDHPELLESMVSGKSNKKDSPYPAVSRRFLTASQAIKLIHDSGGVAILAHPLQTEPDFEKLQVLIADLKKIGLDGIEALYGPNSLERQEELLKIAANEDLLVSAGTDYHTQNGPNPGIDIEMSKWKDFRDAVIKGATNVFWKKTVSVPKATERPKNHWFSFIFRVLMPAALSLFLFIIALFTIILPYFENTLMDRKRESIRELTQVAWSVLNEAAEDAKNGELTLEQAQSLAKNHIEALRYGSENKDYFWLQDLSPRILMHPYRQDLNGQDVSEFKDSEGTRIFVAFSEVVQEKGEGYVSYVWQWKDDFDRLEPKESYIRLFEPWGWIIGTGIYVHDVEAEIANLRSNLLKVSVGIILIVLGLLVYLVRQGLFLERSRSHAERLLNESIERYRALSEAATEGALFVYEGRCRYANTVMYELLGCTSSGLELLDLEDIFPERAENEEWRKYLANKKISDTAKIFHGILRRCDGSDLSCIFTIRNDNSASNSFMILVRRAADNIDHTGTHVALHRLLQLPTGITSDLADSIKKSNKLNEIISLCRKTPDLVLSLLENGTSSIAIAYMISTITDVTTQRIIDLCMKELGTPPVPYTFLAIGSHGRQAQTLHSDQDNALIYRLTEKDDAQEVEKYFLALTARVCDVLEEAGYKKCIGGNIASNPEWCKPLPVWKGYFEEWIRNCEPQQIIEFSIFFDFRPIAGDPGMATELRNFIDISLKETPFFLSQVAQNALLFKTPMRLFGTILTSGGKEHSGRIDVKSPAMAIISFARLYALQQNIHETNTISRLDALKRLGIILDSKHRNLVTVYETLLRLRLWNQALEIEQNRQLDNWVDPGQLGHMEEAILKECFKEIDELQNFIQRDFFT
jgi:CBS domain-containing protein